MRGVGARVAAASLCTHTHIHPNTNTHLHIKKKTRDHVWAVYAVNMQIYILSVDMMAYIIHQITDI